MAVRECERSVRCFPCADENPFANLSAEDPDLNIFLSVDFRRIPNPPHNNWTANVCAAFCESSISQEDADDCARRKTLDCIVDPPPPNPDNPSWPTPIYCNQSSTCQTDGQCYTMPSGTVCAFSALEADALAQSFCNYRVHNPQLTSACSSSPPAPTPEEPCPMESGSAAPDSLEIAAPENWGSFTYEATGTWPAAPSYDIMQLAKDHPPGSYTIQYTSGFRYRSSDPDVDCDFLCNPCTAALQHIEGLWDDSNNVTVGGNYLTLSSFKELGTACFNSVEEAAPDMGGPGQWPAGNDHDNTESPFYIAMDSGYIWNLNSGSTAYSSATLYSQLVFAIIQNAGLIPQPRKVAISNYAALISKFADPAAAASWNGEFPERTVYSSMTVQWAVTAAGAFGGAVLKYIMAHPTSANGKGWQMDIFSAGGILMWRGFRAIGSTPLGRFQKDSTSTPSGPPCCDVADASDDVWYPGEDPP